MCRIPKIYVYAAHTSIQQCLNMTACKPCSSHRSLYEVWAPLGTTKINK